MALFDSVINEAQEKFNLDDKASVLLSVLLVLVTDPNRGGFSGFLNRFNEAGLDDAASSWINSGANTPISYEQTELALGTDALDDISNQTGLEYKTTVSVSAFMLPHIVNELTPDGAVPSNDDLHLKTSEFLSGIAAPVDAKKAGETFDRIGTAAVGITDNGREDIATDDSISKWLLPLVILVLLVIIGFWFCGKSTPPALFLQTQIPEQIQGWWMT